MFGFDFGIPRLPLIEISEENNNKLKKAIDDMINKSKK